MPFETLDPRTPIVLLPVRLETRWFAASATQHELRVRIFPDAAHVTRRRDGVESNERRETERYWRTRIADGENATTTLTAWQSLAATFGVPRAAWLVKALQPRVENGTPVFPDVPLIDDAAASVDTTEATALPSRFMVIGYDGRLRIFAVTGRPVPEALAVGPAEDTDDARRWQIAFDAAEAVGMGVRIRVPVAQAQRITRLIVLGVRESITPDASARTLADLIERHAIDRGAALLPAGSPTNHTATSRAGNALRPNGVPPASGSDGARLATALGLERADLQWVADNERTSDLAARTMNAVLWPATWEYFLEQFAAPLCTPEQRAAGRTLFVDHVRARGPFPSLVLGRQPYGILPVSPMARWKPAQGETGALANLLLQLRGRWMPASAGTPRLPDGGDAMQTLLDILALQPASVRWLGRAAADIEISVPRWLEDFGFEHAIEALRDRLRNDLVEELVPLGFSAEAARQVEPLIYAASPYDVDLPLATRRGFTVFNPGVSPSTYLNAIAAAAPEQLRTHAVSGASPRTLLYLLARVATLRVMERTANDITATAVARPGAAVRDRTVVLDPADGTRATFTRATSRFGNRPAGEILARPDLPQDTIFSPLREHRRALRALAELPPAEVERLAAESLDLASHRLDAWTTALATERLFANRAAGLRGAYIGAYGWLEGGRPPAQLARDGAAPSDAPGHGYVHAPSLEHARTAAVLRAGFVARPTGDLAVNLSSDRVRRARWLLAQMSAGESLAALLGYRIERELIERGLGPQIAGLRAQFPLAESEAGPVAHPRLDGLAAHRSWSATPPAPALRAIAASIAEMIDALADLLLAETVHQQVNGNSGAVAHLLDALEAGSAVPTDPAVVRSPVAVDTVTWQVVLSLGSATPEQWVERLLPPLASLQATMRLRLADGGEMATDVSLSVGALEFGALSPEELAARFAAQAPSGVEVLGVTLSAPLERAHTIARAAHRALKSSRPLEAAPALLAADELSTPFERAAWLSDLARVRPVLEGLELIDLAQRLPISVWKDASRPAERRIVMIGTPPDASALRGLVLDEWKETTPRSEVTTGLAFHHDVPGSRAPQAILIAVPPDPAGRWTEDVLEATIAETIDLSFIRLARPSAVWGRLLPAIYLAENLDDDTVSTPLTDAAIRINVAES